MNEKVVEFARTNVGKQVGDGVCTSLAVEALRAAQARRFPFSDREGDWIWGEEVPSFKEALPGDILQFRDAVFQGKRKISKRCWVTWHQDTPTTRPSSLGSARVGRC